MERRSLTSRLTRLARSLRSAPGVLRELSELLHSGPGTVKQLQADRDRLATELSRRLAELFSLQELTRILSSSLQLDRIVGDLARYTVRLLHAEGGLVILEPEGGGPMSVVAAEGSLAPLLGARASPEEGGIAVEAIVQQRTLHAAATGHGPVVLLGRHAVRGSVVAPLRVHGEILGAVVASDQRSGRFSPEDARLLEAVATHAAVVLANSRFFELIRRGKEHWEATFDALRAGIALVDEGGRIRRANTALAELLGPPVAALIGTHLCTALFGEPALLDELLAAARRGGPLPAPLERRSELLKRSLRIAPARPLARSPAGTVVVVVEDITEQRAIEAKLIQSEKLAAVGTLVSGVAHELNNPLTSIAGLSEFLLEQPAPGEHDREHLRVINEQAERASRIVRNLLTFARKASPEATTVDLADVVRRTLLLMRYELSLHDVEVSLEVDPPDQAPAVLGDRDQLQQVVLNLLSNAAHAVSALPPGRAARIEVAVRAEPACVTLRVRDTGPGIAPATREGLFSPFFTTKAPGEGTGLGLFISYGIAEGHGGSLSADNAKDGTGAVFTLSLPKAPEGAPPTSPAPQHHGPAAQVPRGRRILLVDGDPSVRRLVTALFGRDGHQVDAASDPGYALRLAAEHRYDLIVADRRAATDRGEPFTTALWRLRPEWQARTIVSTSDLRLALDEPADAPPPARSLPKPFNLRDLRDAATAVWGR